jgi:DNA-binding Lrp family transcriptional regulator
LVKKEEEKEQQLRKRKDLYEKRELKIARNSALSKAVKKLDTLDGKSRGQRKGINHHSSSVLQILDETNRSIIRELQKNPEISQVALAEKVSLSQSSIAVRLQKLIGSGLVKDSVSIDYEKLGLSMVRVDVSAKDSHAVLNWVRKCPLCVNGASIVDQSNLSLYFVTEDLQSLSSIIDEHLRKVDGVTQADCHFITSWAWGDSLRMHLDLNVSREDRPPCGISPFCPKCAKNPQYEGKVWPSLRILDFKKEYGV